MALPCAPAKALLACMSGPKPATSPYRRLVRARLVQLGAVSGGGHGARSNTLNLGQENVLQIMVLPNSTYPTVYRCQNWNNFIRCVVAELQSSVWLWTSQLRRTHTAPWRSFTSALRLLIPAGAVDHSLTPCVRSAKKAGVGRLARMIVSGAEVTHDDETVLSRKAVTEDAAAARQRHGHQGSQDQRFLQSSIPDFHPAGRRTIQSRPCGR